MIPTKPMAVALLALPISVTTLSGCGGTEMGRVPFAGEGTASSTITLKPGDVSFWTDVDIEYEGGAALAYYIDLAQGGTKVASATCNPLGRITIKGEWTETNLFGSHTRHGSGKMTCSATLAAGGPTVTTAKLVFSTKPTSLTLRKADLALHQ